MTSTQVYIARDDAGGANMTLGPLPWQNQTLQNTYGGIQVFPTFSYDAVNETEIGPPAFAVFDFDGVAVSLWGTTATAPQDFLVSIDNSTPYNTSTGDTNPQHYMQWYESPELAAGQHSVNVSNIRATSLDLLLITPGLDTSLGNQSLLVDDTYLGIKYTGSGWTTTTDEYFARSAAVPAHPLFNGTHQTSTSGDSLFFAFAGTRAQIFGNILANSTGTMTLSYSIDNAAPQTTQHTYKPPVGAGGSSQSAKPIDDLYVSLVDTGTLTATAHTIDITYSSDASPFPFIVDFILYEPSFTTLRTMPDLTNLSAPSPSSNTSQPSVTVVPSASAINSPSGGSNRQNVGAIVGSVIGGLCLIALVLVGLLILHRRRRKPKGIGLEEDVLRRTYKY